MKGNKALIILLIIILIALGWSVCIFRSGKNIAEYQKTIKEANEFYEKGLYQKAAIQYEIALGMKESEKVRKLMVEALRCAYNDSAISVGEFSNALSEYVEIYDDSVEGWETAISFYKEQGNDDKTFEMVKKAKKENVNSETIELISNTIKYKVKRVGTGFEYKNVAPLANKTVIKNGDYYGIVSADGKDYVKSKYEYISPVNKDFLYVVSLGESYQVFDSKGIVQGKVEVPFDEMKAPADDVVPVKFEERWKLYNYVDKEYALPNNYDEISSVTDGMIAVCNSGKWEILDENFENKLGTSYTDVKMFENGEFISNNRYVAAENGLYGLYKLNGEKALETVSDDMDLYLGDLIAYKSNGKWGFMNDKGVTVIEPKYSDAKSFSNGLGMVSDGEMWAFINADGLVVSEYCYAEGTYVSKEYSCILREGTPKYDLCEFSYLK